MLDLSCLLVTKAGRNTVPPSKLQMLFLMKRWFLGLTASSCLEASRPLDGSPDQFVNIDIVFD